jgi:hypothetical protein
MFRLIWSSIKCFEIAVEIAALQSISSNPKYTVIYVPMCCGFMVMGDSSCRVECRYLSCVVTRLWGWMTKELCSDSWQELGIILFITAFRLAHCASYLFHVNIYFHY